jgi:DNA ligase-1
MITKPMLADKVKDVGELGFPLIASPKVDGIRCLNPDGRILTRSFKPVPNAHIRTILKRLLPVGSDGELFSADNFQQCTSDIMSEDGEPEFQFCMFDFVPNGDIAMPYVKRMEAMLEWFKTASPEQRKIIKPLPFQVVNNVDELREYEKQALADGFEGVMLRDPNGPYKCGRSTWREGYLLKLKIFLDSEAEVVGLEEMMHNDNKLEKDELGHAKRSSAKAGKIPAGKLGKFIVVDMKTGVEFKCGTGEGLTMEMRQEIWDNRDSYLGKIIKYKYQPHGVKNKPRCPIWLGFRDLRDMSR